MGVSTLADAFISRSKADPALKEYMDSYSAVGLTELKCPMRAPECCERPMMLAKHISCPQEVSKNFNQDSLKSLHA